MKDVTTLQESRDTTDLFYGLTSRCCFSFSVYGNNHPFIHPSKSNKQCGNHHLSTMPPMHPSISLLHFDDAHISCLYLGSCFLSHDLYLMTLGEGLNVDKLANGELHLSFFTMTDKNNALITADERPIRSLISCSIRLSLGDKIRLEISNSSGWGRDLEETQTFSSWGPQPVRIWEASDQRLVENAKIVKVRAQLQHIFIVKVVLLSKHINRLITYFQEFTQVRVRKYDQNH